LIDDEGVVLIKHKFIGEDERIYCNWCQTHVWSADGSFFIGAQDDKKTFVVLSYIYEPNVHVLEHVIRMGFKKGVRKLSDILQSE
jgi:hypothetical protein